MGVNIASDEFNVHGMIGVVLIMMLIEIERCVKARVGNAWAPIKFHVVNFTHLSSLSEALS